MQATLNPKSLSFKVCGGTVVVWSSQGLVTILRMSACDGPWFLRSFESTSGFRAIRTLVFGVREFRLVRIEV